MKDAFKKAMKTAMNQAGGTGWIGETFGRKVNHNPPDTATEPDQNQKEEESEDEQDLAPEMKEVPHMDPQDLEIQMAEQKIKGMQPNMQQLNAHGAGAISAEEQARLQEILGTIADSGTNGRSGNSLRERAGMGARKKLDSFRK